ncbi:MAG: Uma2 family endonuclease [Ginsengibacter sp.]
MPMSAVKLLPHYTYEDYCNWEGRWEVIDGIPFAMSPAPTPRHQWLIVNIASELKAAIKKSKCKHCKVYDFIDVKIEEDTILQPDCSIVCKPITKKFLDFPAALVIEILSPATALKDRHTKFSLYEKFGIKYYMIVDEEKESVEIYILTDKQYVLTSHSLSKSFTFILSDDCKIDLWIKNIWE